MNEDDSQRQTGDSVNNNNAVRHSYTVVQPYSSNHLSDASFNTCAADQFVLQHNRLPNKWLLLDSCSTTDIVSNIQLLTNVHDAPTPTWVRCNAGRIQLTQRGYLGDYPHAVWYNPKGVANILSLHNVSDHY